jgi:hypothetical protein
MKVKADSSRRLLSAIVLTTAALRWMRKGNPLTEEAFQIEI